MWPDGEYFVYCTNGECRLCHLDIDVGGEELFASPGSSMSTISSYQSSLEVSCCYLYYIYISTAPKAKEKTTGSFHGDRPAVIENGRQH